MWGDGEAKVGALFVMLMGEGLVLMEALEVEGYGFASVFDFGLKVLLFGKVKEGLLCLAWWYLICGESGVRHKRVELLKVGVDLRVEGSVWGDLVGELE